MNLIPEVDEFNRGSILFGFKGDLEQILDFLNYKENPNLTDFFGTTLLHFAVIDHYDNFEMVEKLIKTGADVNAQNNCKQTPLHLAVIRYNWRIIDTLIAYNADINVEELKGNTALHFAVDLLWSGRKRYQQETRSWIVKKLLHSGADPNKSNNNGETPLMIAVKYGALDIVRDLLAFGANVYVRNKHSETCLHLLSWSAQPDIAILHELLSHGACVNCCDDIGRTALDVLLELTDKVSSGRRLAESFIKISTLVNWKHKIVFQVTSLNQEKVRSLDKFVDECYKEVSRMKSIIYSNGSSLCYFAINGEKVGETDKFQINILDEVLNSLIRHEFPIYNYLIEARFNKAFLKEKLFEINIYARNEKDKVRLHPYAKLDIASYLSERDILNLIRAYTEPLNNSFRNDKINWFT